MSRISILPDLLINKIAAGEVIERPAAVVRELIDNAIDAGAARIDIEVLHGGKKLIRVSDNGAGMDREDAMLCFQRHATSKVSSEDDLFHLSTLGFRGEALPSIASVAKVLLTTATEGAETGTIVEIGAHHKKEIREAPPLKGTTVEIRDLFYNTPARKKFLKTVPTELSHIIETVLQKAFAYRTVAFTLVHNSSEVLNTPAAADLKERFSQLYGEEMAGDFLEVKKESKAMSITGFASRADFTRATKSHQLIFVNQRPVKNPTVNHGVYHAYREVLPKDRHPAYFLFLDIDPGSVDVNVHPAKREVKFERPDDIHRFVNAAIYEALTPGSVIDLSPLSSIQRPEFHRYPGSEYTPADSPAMTALPAKVSEPAQEDFFSSGRAPGVSSFFHVGESFIASATDDGLVIIDQHAAHERVLYERFLKKSFIETELLFLPLRIELPVKEYHILIRHRDFIRGFGLDIEDFGGNSIILRSLPKELRKADMKSLLLDLAAGILEEDTEGIQSDLSEESLLKNIAARLACHKSVRGSEHLNNEELSRMVADLNKTEEPDKCPHGRPTRIRLSLHDLNRMFKRK